MEAKLALPLLSFNDLQSKICRFLKSALTELVGLSCVLLSLQTKATPLLSEESAQQVQPKSIACVTFNTAVAH